MSTTRGRVMLVVAVASVTVAACAEAGDLVKATSTDSVIESTAPPASVVPTAAIAVSDVTSAEPSGSVPVATQASVVIVGQGVGVDPNPPTTPPPLTAVPTTPPTTAPPTTPPRPAVTPLTEDEAILAWNSYLAETTARDYPTAWTRLTERYQIKYISYDTFKRFWETVDGAGVYSYTVVATIPDGLTLEMHVWYGRRKDGTVSNELVDVDMIKDTVTGTILVDDYRFIAHE